MMNEKQGRLIYRKLIIFGFVILAAFYIGYIIGKNAAVQTREKSKSLTGIELKISKAKSSVTSSLTYL